MKVLITGGSGFIAAWIIKRLLARGWTPTLFDFNPQRHIVRGIVGPAADNLKWITGDIADAGAVRDAAADCALTIHLAGLLTPACQADPKRGAEVNLIGTLNVFEAAKHHGHRMVLYASSAGVYGPASGEPPRPETHYGAFKLATEGSARAYWNTDRMPSVGFRPFVVYGPGRETGISAGPTLACAAAVRGERYTIGYTGRSDLLYVDDVAAAFESAAVLQPQGAHAFNLRGEIADIVDVITAIRHHVPGAQLSAEGAALPIDAQLAADGVDAVLPGLPHTSLADGIEATIRYYQAARDAQPKAEAQAKADTEARIDADPDASVITSTNANADARTIGSGDVR